MKEIERIAGQTLNIVCLALGMKVPQTRPPIRVAMRKSKQKYSASAHSTKALRLEIEANNARLITNYMAAMGTWQRVYDAFAAETKLSHGLNLDNS